jgi:hypothetical protein
MCKTYAGKRKTDSVYNETSWFASNISRPQPVKGSTGTQEVSVPSCREDNPLPESGIGNGFDLYKAAGGTCVPYGNN